MHSKEKRLDYDALRDGCESEQLHLSGAIQSHGAIVRIERITKKITHVSKNISEFMGVEPDAMLEYNFDSISSEISSFIDKLPIAVSKRYPYLTAIKFNEIDLNAVLYFDENDGVLIEIEKQAAPILDVKTVHALQANFTSAPNTKDELQHQSQLLVDSIKQITGYDRVMFYRFLDDWSGEVVAEATNSDIGSYLGLRFPAADIPSIARNLYILNPSRPIPNTKSQAVDIVSKSGEILNLTYSELRSVSPVHLQYLENMGIRASISFAIKSIDNLYGLIACHNLNPKSTPMETREHCIGLIQTYSLGVSYFRMQNKMKTIDGLNYKIENLLESIALYEDKPEGFGQNAKLLLDLFDARGLVLAIDNNISYLGAAPDADFFDDLDGFFVNQCKETIYLNDNLSSNFTCDTETISNASGVLAIKYNSTKSGLIRIYWFRPEIQTEILWAGNPDKPTAEDVNAIALSPRRSFDKYIEVKQGFSRPWSGEEKMAAASFKKLLTLWM